VTGQARKCATCDAWSFPEARHHQRFCLYDLFLDFVQRLKGSHFSANGSSHSLVKPTSFVFPELLSHRSLGCEHDRNGTGMV
jgi:hypothetical protein